MRRVAPALLPLVAATLLASCGGGDDGGGDGGGGGATLPPPGPPLVRVSSNTPFADGCSPSAGGTLYRDAEVEPHIAIDPGDPQRLLAAWQQDRFSNGGARGLVTARSSDGGNTWTRAPLPASRCGGGSAAFDTAFDRATDPWVAFGADGRAYAIALGFEADGGAAIDNAMIVFRSFDGGATWGPPTLLITDGAANFNDKEAIAADPVDPSYAYASWDRLTGDNRGPAMFTRTTDGGSLWEAARVVYDPGVGNQTINVTPAVAPDGDVFLYFTRIIRGGAPANEIVIMRSTDHGATFSAPVVVAANRAVGARDPSDGSRIRDGSILSSLAIGPSGELVMAWQDSRFSTGGVHDNIVFSTSTDDGATWSPVTRLTATGVSAFTPTAAVRADGKVGISFFDMREEVAGDGLLSIVHWLQSSDDLATWTEARISQAFDIGLAPVANGLFIGDYMGLVTSGSSFVPLFVQTNNQGSLNRNDVYVLPVGQIAPVASVVRRAGQATIDVVRPIDDVERRLTYQAAMQQFATRVPDWAARQAAFEAAAERVR